jgi:hypothetical protein
MFRATVCPSSGETTVFMRHLVLAIMYGWLSGTQGGITLVAHYAPIIRRSNCIYATLGTCYSVWMTIRQTTRQSSMQNNKYQVSHKYSCFSWWWAHSRPKHVEKRQTYKKILHQVGFIYKISVNIYIFTQFHQVTGTRERKPCTNPIPNIIPLTQTQSWYDFCICA